MDEFDNSILAPREIAAILFATLFLSIAFYFFVDIFGERLSLLIGELLIILPALGYAWNRRLPLAKTFRLHKISLAEAAATLLVFIPLFILTDELDRLIQTFFPMPESWLESLTDILAFSTWQETVIILFAGVVFAAFFEEMLFRGMLQRSLEHFREPASAIVLSSVLFALVHFNPWTSIQIVMLGVVLGYVTWKSQSIFPAVILHGLNNLSSLLMMNASDGSLNWYAKGDHVNIIWLCLAVALVVPTFKLFEVVSNE